MPERSKTTVLSFDFGLRRIGVAVGHADTHIAQPLGTLSATRGKPDWRAIAQLIDEWTVQAFVIGLPLDPNGETQPITRSAQRFGRRLAEQFPLPIYWVDERYSTRIAKQHYQAHLNQDLDAKAACLILEQWFDQDTPS